MTKRSSEEDISTKVKRVCKIDSIPIGDSDKYCVFVGWTGNGPQRYIYKKEILDNEYIKAYLEDSILDQEKTPSVPRFDVDEDILKSGDHPMLIEINNWISGSDFNYETEYFKIVDFGTDDTEIIEEYKAKCMEIWALIKETYVGTNLKFSPNACKMIPIEINYDY